jgi:hypothetical protein
MDITRDLSSNQITGEFPVAVTKMMKIQELYALFVLISWGSGAKYCYYCQHY